MKRTLLFLSLLLLTMLGIVPEGYYAQTQCATADEVSYPFDPDVFGLVQGYAVPSPRHHGRYHTGEDWAGKAGETLGTPVRAIANGRVTYSYPLGWGRDGGVVIIEHTFADGAVLYSQYGHMMETDDVTFPMRLSCVSAGDVIGVVGDARPAPHVHFEIRVSGSDTPGPGYSWQLPDDLGWRHPSRFIENYNAARQSSYRWDLQTVNLNGFNTPPLLLNDQSLLYIDGSILRLATYDGRVLWRKLLNKAAPAVVGVAGSAHLIYADGDVHRLDAEGNTLETWRLPLEDGESLTPPLHTTPPDSGGDSVSTAYFFYTSAGDVIRVSDNLREIVWRVRDVATPRHIVDTGLLTGILTRADDVLIISNDGDVRDEAKLRGSAAWLGAPDGELTVLSRGGLWAIDADGTWRLRNETVRASGIPALVRADNLTVAYDDAPSGGTITAFDGNFDVVWSFALPALPDGGQINGYVFDGKAVFLDESGYLIAFNGEGRVCGQVNLFGDAGALMWADLDRTGILRVLVDNTVMGFDWLTLTRGCA